MTLNDIQELARRANVDIVGHILSTPIETQQQVAKEMGFDDFDDYVRHMIDELQNKQDEPKTLTAREYLDDIEPNKRWGGAGYLGRVFGGDMSPLEVLKVAGYTDGEIANFKQLAK